MLLNKKEFSEDEIRILVKSCLNRNELANKLGYTYFNGKVVKIIDKIIADLKIDISHFDRYFSNRLRTKYDKIKKDCPVCKVVFITEKGSRDEKVTCSSKCSNTYFSESKHTELSNLKRSLKLLKKYDGKHTIDTKTNKIVKIVSLVCPLCKKSFTSSKETQKCCSQSCATKLNWQNPKYKAHMTACVNERIANGEHKGWASREKMVPSFPEKVTMEILAELELHSLKREFKCGKWFIDFADVERKIALEIDGKQHEFPERKASDETKDSFLVQEGWTVHRIKWKKLTDKSRVVLKDKIKEIFN